MVRKDQSVNKSSYPKINPDIVLREEYDNWALLYDPASGKTFGINPVSVFVWMRLDGNHTLSEILMDLREHCSNVPEDALEHLKEFVKDLLGKGFVTLNE